MDCVTLFLQFVSKAKPSGRRHTKVTMNTICVDCFLSKSKLEHLKARFITEEMFRASASSFSNNKLVYDRNVRRCSMYIHSSFSNKLHVHHHHHHHHYHQHHHHHHYHMSEPLPTCQEVLEVFISFPSHRLHVTEPPSRFTALTSPLAVSCKSAPLPRCQEMLEDPASSFS